MAVVVASYALYMAYDEGGEEELRAAIVGISSLNPRHLVVADKMLFGPPDSRGGYETLPQIGTVVNLLAGAGFTLTDVEIVSDSVGVLVATRPSRWTDEGDSLRQGFYRLCDLHAAT